MEVLRLGEGHFDFFTICINSCRFEHISQRSLLSSIKKVNPFSSKNHSFQRYVLISISNLLKLISSTHCQFTFLNTYDNISKFNIFYEAC